VDLGRRVLGDLPQKLVRRLVKRGSHGGGHWGNSLTGSGVPSWRGPVLRPRTMSYLEHPWKI
jgi:hypothetical protein